MKYYDKKLLRFLYELTKLKSFASHKEISKQLTKNGFKISPKTVERWFKFLRGMYKYPKKTEHGPLEKFAIFNYSPKFLYEKIGLQGVYVIIENPKKNLLRSYPFQKYNEYAAKLFDTMTSQEVLIYGFKIPSEFLKKFDLEWKILKDQGKIGGYRIFEINSSFMVSSPWHKTIDESGLFDPRKNISKEIDEQLSHFKSYIDKIPKTKLSEEVKRNSLILPTIFEQHRKGWSSSKVWKYIKKKLGNGVWDYFKKNKKRTNNVGIKGIQKAMQDIHELSIFHRMALIYMPFELRNNFYIYSHLKFDSREELIDCVRNISLNSISTNVYPMKNDELFIINLINNVCLPKIFDIFSKTKVGGVYFLQHEKSLPLLTNDSFCIFDYSKAFDPKKFSWKI